ncbi:MAG: DNA-binding protein, partial [Sulfurimonas sp.]|nr:DNA-binding protein [Sulfurimonas sp.]
NERLRQKVDKLEWETKSLREQKEQMLIQERIRIEKIYKDKDEQLKNMLNAISSKFLQHIPKQELVIESEELVEAEIEVDEEKPTLISLKKYFKESSLSEKKLKKLKQKFKKAIKEDDSRFISMGKKHYLDTSKYDYSDLLA